MLPFAVRAARFCPRAIPEMVFDERRFVPIVVVATTWPFPFVPRRALDKLVKKRFVWRAFVEKRLVEVAFVATKFVVVAFVEVAFVLERFAMVEDARTMTPTVEVGARYPFVSDQVFPKLRLRV